MAGPAAGDGNRRRSGAGGVPRVPRPGRRRTKKRSGRLDGVQTGRGDPVVTIADALVARHGLLAGTDVTAAAQLAFLLEASAPKPGNVSPGRHFSDLRYED